MEINHLIAQLKSKKRFLLNDKGWEKVKQFILQITGQADQTIYSLGDLSREESKAALFIFSRYILGYLKRSDK